MTTVRKHYTLTENEVDKLKGAAAAAGMALGPYVRSMIEGFMEVGSDHQAEPTKEVVVLIDPDLVQQAEYRARTKYHCSLRDILRFEIAELDKL